MDATEHYRKIHGILEGRFGGHAPATEISLAAKDVFALTAEDDLEWEEMRVSPEEFGFTVSSECANICRLAAAVAAGDEIRVLRRKAGAGAGRE